MLLMLFARFQMAQTAKPPAYILFYCEEPAASGGATPIVLSQEVWCKKIYTDVQLLKIVN